ncbi:MAG: exodeoxyribonuclease VII large subunit [Mediterraneibacter sp.]|nr:exodeoxyribonuclease VII large subunit [Candidatus Mediterraneibacter caccogallinarum]
MRNVYTVKQVNSYIKNMFTQDFMLNRIYVKGEVSNCKYHTSGHIYFSLKDESGTIACVMFAGSRAGLSFRMKEGQQVIVLGSISVYERDGKYQLYAREIVPDGAGLLYEKFEALKKELAEMGMFAPEYKQPIPKYVRTVGIVTAPTGAAVRDIINIAGRRNPYVQLILYPALVQGEGAAESIVKGIHALEAKQVDVIIVGRGGGSIEDLWAFNEEAVARAVFDCTVPVISAVGHETDTTITDYVADLRAPTPSAAAELAVYEYREVKETMLNCAQRMRRAVLIRADAQRARLKQMELRLKFAHPRQKLNEKRQYCVELEDRLRNLMDRRLIAEKHRLALSAEKMKGLSPLEKLNQGFSFVQDENGRNIKSIRQVRQGERLTVYVTDGKIETEVISAAGTEYPGTEKAPGGGA